jgi:hypothetical protein
MSSIGLRTPAMTSISGGWRHTLGKHGGAVIFRPEEISVRFLIKAYWNLVILSVPNNRSYHGVSWKIYPISQTPSIFQDMGNLTSTSQKHERSKVNAQTQLIICTRYPLMNCYIQHYRRRQGIRTTGA